MSIEVRGATEEDWPDLVKGFTEFTESSYSHRFDLNMDNFRKFFRMNLTNRLVCVVVSKYEGKLVGITIIYELHQPFVDMLMKRTHIHIAAWIPEFFGIPVRISRSISDATMRFIEEWAIARGHDAIIANTRVSEPGKNNYKYRAVEKRYGFTPQYTTIMKPLGGNNG